MWNMRPEGGGTDVHSIHIIFLFTVIKNYQKAMVSLGCTCCTLGLPSTANPGMPQLDAGRYQCPLMHRRLRLLCDQLSTPVLAGARVSPVCFRPAKPADYFSAWTPSTYNRTCTAAASTLTRLSCLRDCATPVLHLHPHRSQRPDQRLRDMQPNHCSTVPLPLCCCLHRCRHCCRRTTPLPPLKAPLKAPLPQS